MIVADEGLNGKIVREVRENGYSVIWILEIAPGISDLKVIEYTKNKNRLLITEDKDFGEWVFAHKVKGLTVLFLRYEKEDCNRVIEYVLSLLSQLKKRQGSSNSEFITINKNKIRRRRI